MRHAILLFALLATATPAMAGERWQLLYVNGQEAGFAFERTRPVDDDPAVAFETTSEMMFRIKRMGKPLEISTRLVTREDASGQVRSIRQTLDFSNQETVYEGVVRDGRMHVTAKTVGPARESVIEDWPADVPGPEELRRRVLATGFRPGASISFHQFEFTLGAPMAASIEVEAEERLEVRGREELLFRTRLVPSAPELPPTTTWVDVEGQTCRSSSTMLGMTIETVLVDEARVAEYRASGDPAEMFMQSTVTANVRLPRPRSLDSILYRVRAKSGDLPDLTTPSQRFLSTPDDQGFRLMQIDKRVPPAGRGQVVDAPPGDAPREFLAPNPMMQSDSDELIRFAREQIRDQVDAWDAAVRLERAVYERISKKSMDVAFASALETWRTGVGDCSEHAVLLGTLCRAVGVPARVVMGLVYVGGIFGGHAWTEVQIDGEWYALDGTIGRGSVDPTHISLGTTSLKDGSFAGGLLKAISGLGNLDLTIVEYTQGRNTVRIEGTARGSTVKDGLFLDPVEGITFALPAGFAIDAVETDLTEMTNVHRLVELRARHGDARIDVTARQVPYEFTAERFVTDVRARVGQGAADEPIQVAGRDGRLVTAGDLRVAGVLVDDTLYTVRGRALDDDAEAAFARVVESLTVE